MGEELFFVVIIIISCLDAYFIPILAYRFAQYRWQKKGKSILQAEPKMKIKLLSLLFCGAFAIVALSYMPLRLGIIAIVFCQIALFGIYVDHLIRIIANKMILVILVFGIIYRVIEGGVISLLGSLGAVLLVIAIFAAAAGVTFVRTGGIGVGMGDIKLSMAIAIVVGYPGVLYFLAGIAAAILIYSSIGLLMRRLFLNSTFPMCGHIMVGFLIALMVPYLPYFVK